MIKNIITLFGVLFLATLAAAKSDYPGEIFGSNEGYALRLNEISETTSWPFLEDCHLTHYLVRNRHNASELRLNRTLIDYARLKSLIYAWYDGDLPEDNKNLFDENVFWDANGTEDNPSNCTDAIGSWYAESTQWDYENPHLTKENRHFATLVWKNNKRYGCGQALSRGSKGGMYTVCYYHPGVVEGEEKENVQNVVSGNKLVI